MPGLCGKMIAGVFRSGFFSSLAQMVSFFHVCYHGLNIIQHFFCDMPQIITLSCSYPCQPTDCLSISNSHQVWFFSCYFLILLLHCGCYPENVFRQTLLQGLQCLCLHLAAVILFHDTVLLVYMHHSSGHTMEQNKVLSVVHVVFIPMLNPLTCSLRNKEIKEV